MVGLSLASSRNTPRDSDLDCCELRSAQGDVTCWGECAREGTLGVGSGDECACRLSLPTAGHVHKRIQLLTRSGHPAAPATGAQRLDLVLHQAEQRADHNLHIRGQRAHSQGIYAWGSRNTTTNVLSERSHSDAT